MSITRQDFAKNVRNEENIKTFSLSYQALDEASLVDHIVPFLKDHPEIKHVKLEYCFREVSITFTGLKALLEVKSIESLNLSKNIISHESAEALKFSEVAELDISCCHFTDDMLDNLNHNEHLIKLEVGGYAEDDQLSHLSIRTLSTLPNLKSLDIRSSLPGEEGCKVLAEMTLETLHMDDCKINSAMMSKFRNNNTLVELSLYKNPLGDEGMVVISTMKALKKLVAYSTQLTDLATVYLASSPSLLDVAIHGEDERRLVDINTSYNRYLEGEINNLITNSYTNKITNDGQRILAGNPNLKECAFQFCQYFSSGYFGMHEDTDESPISKLNFSRKKGATPPFPSLKDISMFAFRSALADNPSLASEETLDQLSNVFTEEADRYNRRDRL